MKKPLTPDKALERLEALCARSEQAVADARRKLALWGIDSRQADAIVADLAKRRYLDDARFARSYCRDKYRFDRWGRRKIRMGLIAKRIESGIIDAALAEIDEDVYRENLTALLRAKARSLGDEAQTYDGRTRLFRYGASRGYEPALVIEIIKSQLR